MKEEITISERIVVIDDKNQTITGNVIELKKNSLGNIVIVVKSDRPNGF